LRSEEQIERLIEPREVVATMYEEGAKRRAHIVSAADTDPLERSHRVEEPAVWNRQACASQEAAEEKEVGDEGEHGARNAASTACERSTAGSSHACGKIRQIAGVAARIPGTQVDGERLLIQSRRPHGSTPAAAMLHWVHRFGAGR
jgi:hypothetical protein